MLNARAYLPILLLFCLPSLCTGQEAIDSLKAILGQTLHDTVRQRILFEIGRCEIETDTLEAIMYLDQAFRLSEEMEDTRGQGLYYEIRGDMNRIHGDYTCALLNYDRALAYYSETDDDNSYYRTVKNKGNIYLFMADYAQALNLYNSALDYYRRIRNNDGVSRVLNNIGIIHKNKGNYLEALTTYEESLRYLDEEEDAMSIAQGYINVGNVFVYLGIYERALEYFERALEVAEKNGSRKDIALCNMNCGVLQHKCGNFQEAMNMYQRSLADARGISDPVLISNVLINMGVNYSAMGQLDKALELLRQGLDIKAELGDDKAISNCYANMAEVYQKQGNLVESEDLYRRALPVKEKLGDQEGLVRCHLGLGSLYLTLERYADAQMHVDTGLVVSEQIGALEHMAEAYKIKQGIAEASGFFRDAYDYAMLHRQFKDSLVSQTTTMALVDMEFRHRSRTLEKENENLRIQSRLTSELMEKRTFLFYSLIGIAVLLALGLILVFYFMRRLRMGSNKLEEKNLVITRQNLKLDELNKNKDKMMSIIAHDLRGTMGNLLTAIDVLHHVEGEDAPEIDRKKLLRNLRQSASYSLELLENLLHWSRLEENEAYFQPEPVQLDKLIRNCVNLFEESARLKEVTIREDMQTGIQCQVDQVMMETIVRNLISNALKFSHPGGAIIIHGASSNGLIHLSVADQGIGITEDQIRKITRNGGYTRKGTANEKGAGIGLTLVREFAARHKGELLIHSHPGQGSTFEIQFPCSS